MITFITVNMRGSAKVLLSDGHYSYMSFPLIKRARSLEIHLICLPPNSHSPATRHWCFGASEVFLAKNLKMYEVQTQAANVPKKFFPSLVNQLWSSNEQHFQNVMLVGMVSKVSGSTNTSVWVHEDTMESRVP